MTEEPGSDGHVPAKLSEQRIKCPSCGKETLVITDYLYEMPYVGKVILTTGKCGNCGYKYSDVRLAEAKEPGKIVFEVQHPEDLNALVVRSSSASILVPELGLEMVPGPASEGFITTVEGVLERFLEALEAACNSPDSDKGACEEARRKIIEAKEGKRKFTLVIVDPEGVSAIVSPKARRLSVSKDELRRLGYLVPD